jgi:hypothetical protein
MEDQAIQRNIQLITVLLKWPEQVVPYFYQTTLSPTKVQGTRLSPPLLTSDNELIEDISNAINDRSAGKDTKVELLVSSVKAQGTEQFFVVNDGLIYEVKRFSNFILQVLLEYQEKARQWCLYSDLYTNSQLINAGLCYLNSQIPLISAPSPVLYSNIGGKETVRLEDEQHQSVQISRAPVGGLGNLAFFLDHLPEPWGSSEEFTITGVHLTTTIIDGDVLRALLTELTCQLDQLQQLVEFRGHGLVVSDWDIEQKLSHVRYREIDFNTSLMLSITNLERSTIVLDTGDRKLALCWIGKKRKIKQLRVGSLDLPTGYYPVDYTTVSKYPSWDYYTTILSLLLHPSVYYRWFSEEELIENFWVPLWADVQVANTLQEVLLGAIREHLPITRETIACLLQPYLLKEEIVNEQIQRLGELTILRKAKNVPDTV